MKQGGKVKSWKKRLFVLDSEGLSYFKTDQVSSVCKFHKPYSFQCVLPVIDPIVLICGSDFTIALCTIITPVCMR